MNERLQKIEERIGDAVPDFCVPSVSTLAACYLTWTPDGLSQHEQTPEGTGDVALAASRGHEDALLHCLQLMRSVVTGERTREDAMNAIKRALVSADEHYEGKEIDPHGCLTVKSGYQGGRVIGYQDALLILHGKHEHDASILTGENDKGTQISPYRETDLMP